MESDQDLLKKFSIPPCHVALRRWKSDKDHLLENGISKSLFIRLCRLKMSEIMRYARVVPCENFKVHYHSRCVKELAIKNLPQGTEEVDIKKLYETKLISGFHALPFNRFKDIVQRSIWDFRHRSELIRKKEEELKQKLRFYYEKDSYVLLRRVDAEKYLIKIERSLNDCVPSVDPMMISNCKLLSSEEARGMQEGGLKSKFNRGPSNDVSDTSISESHQDPVSASIVPEFSSVNPFVSNSNDSLDSTTTFSEIFKSDDSDHDSTYEDLWSVRNKPSGTDVPSAHVNTSISESNQDPVSASTFPEFGCVGAIDLISNNSSDYATTFSEMLKSYVSDHDSTYEDLWSVRNNPSGTDVPAAHVNTSISESNQDPVSASTVPEFGCVDIVKLISNDSSDSATTCSEIFKSDDSDHDITYDYLWSIRTNPSGTDVPSAHVNTSISESNQDLVSACTLPKFGCVDRVNLKFK